jgi:hypothetical protein
MYDSKCLFSTVGCLGALLRLLYFLGVLYRYHSSDGFALLARSVSLVAL